VRLVPAFAIGARLAIEPPSSPPPLLQAASASADSDTTEWCRNRRRKSMTLRLDKLGYLYLHALDHKGLGPGRTAYGPSDFSDRPSRINHLLRLVSFKP
jgi:hypothetical protein